MSRIYAAIDLKSFYASVECAERNLDPLNTNLVVADESRTDRTICLAVSPSLKALGIAGRPRLFEVKRAVSEINKKRGKSGSSYFDDELKSDSGKAVDFIIAPPRMSLYIDYSRRIYGIYLRYISKDDIHVYSIDEVFADITDYLSMYGKKPEELVSEIIKTIIAETGITATAGIGTNLYLAKIAMDVYSKHIECDENGTRIATLDEYSYRKSLWDHTPITDFWRIGRGYSERLSRLRLFTMGDIARFSLKNEDALFDVFGVNAEILIDHAWGMESVTMPDIKKYKSKSKSLSSGQVLPEAYNSVKGLTLVKEMADSLALNLAEKCSVSDQITISIGYEGLREHGTVNFGSYTSSATLAVRKATELFNSIVRPDLPIRRLTVTLNHVIPETEAPIMRDLFTDGSADEREKSVQRTVTSIKKKFGKNSILRGMNLEEGARQKERNEQIGGHKA